jgi:hypothetical protein
MGHSFRTYRITTPSRNRPEPTLTTSLFSPCELVPSMRAALSPSAFALIGVSLAANLGRARVELLRRDNEYVEEQERSRREYESDRDLKRQQFATALADKQLVAATAVAKATKLAAWAAGLSAAGAVVTAIVEVIRLLA